MKTAALNASLKMTRKPKRSPSFFKVLIGDFVNHLRIPPAFVKNVFKGNVPTRFILNSDSGSSWPVRVQVKVGCYFFSGGWSNFVKDHRLETGDFLVFFLVGSSMFDVLIYNRTACVKDINLAAKRRGGRPVVNRQTEETPSKKRASGSKKARGVSRGAIRRRARNVSQKIEFVSEATSEHPSFVMVLKEYQKYNVVVPRSFVEETGLAKKPRAVIKGPKGGVCRLNTVVDSRQFRLGCGWSQFLQENEIVVGDTLLFEQNPDTGNVIHVQIVSKAGDGNWGRRNKQACGKNIPAAAKRRRGRPVVNSQIEETPSKKRASSSKRAGGVSRGRASVRGARNVTSKIEIVSEENSGRPSFVVLLKEYQRYSLAVPSSFAEEMGLADELRTLIKDPKGREWQLNTIVNPKSQVRLGAGWFKFLQENKLVVGDTLLFEHIPNTGNVIHFKIISKAGNGNRGRRNRRANVC